MELNTRSVSIYVLCEPGTDIVRYVGITTNTLKKRLAHHLIPSQLKAKTHKNDWLKSLNGIKPDIKIVRIVTLDTWEYYERFYINYYSSLGCDLVNYAEGGRGSLGYKLTPEQRERQRIGVKNRAYKHTPEMRKQLSQSKKGVLNPMFGVYGEDHPKHKSNCKGKNAT